MDIHNPRTPGHQKRLGEPWRSFSRRDKVLSLAAIVTLFVIINLAFSDLGDGLFQEEDPAVTTTEG